jgi:hypothetical protein
LDLKRSYNVLPPIKVAFVLDNKVVDVLHTDERLGAILLSNPLIVDVTGDNNTQLAFLDDTYNPDTNTFISSKVIDFDDEEPSE